MSILKRCCGLLIAAYAITLGVHAAPARSLSRGQAEPPVEVKKASRAMLTIRCYDAGGQCIATGPAIFISEEGHAVCAYSLLDGATRAEVVDEKGKVYPLHRILGASALYDLAKFSVEGVKKCAWFSLKEQATVPGTGVSCLRPQSGKKDVPATYIITQADEYNQFQYLHTSVPNDSTLIGCPLMDGEGRIVGFVQRGTLRTDSTAYAMDARFVSTLTITSRSALSSDLRALKLPKALPHGADDALTYITMMGTTDTAALSLAIHDFITAYPNRADGYTNRAITLHVPAGRYADAEADFATALERSRQEGSPVGPDWVHSQWCQAIFQKAQTVSDSIYESWNLQRAQQEAAQAYAIKPMPFYLLQQGRCYYSMRQFAPARDTFIRLATQPDSVGGEWSAVARAESWFFAARSQEMLADDSLRVIALIDSAIQASPRPYNEQGKQYFIERASRLFAAGQYRAAISDYNTYESLIGPSRLSSRFYYIREQAYLEVHAFQQALDDINSAISKAPQEPLYQLEAIIIYLRAGELPDAESKARQFIQAFPDIAEGYKLLGLALGNQGKKKEAVQALQTAVTMGDSTAGEYISRYK